eukprot:3071438-Amphidinium_carterae.1
MSWQMWSACSSSCSPRYRFSIASRGFVPDLATHSRSVGFPATLTSARWYFSPGPTGVKRTEFA